MESRTLTGAWGREVVVCVVVFLFCFFSACFHLLQCRQFWPSPFQIGLRREGEVNFFFSNQFQFMLKWKTYLFWFQKVLICLLIIVGSDFMDIWRSAVGAKIGVKNGQKYRVLTMILKKTTFKTLRLFHFLTKFLENLHEVLEIQKKFSE